MGLGVCDEVSWSVAGWAECETIWVECVTIWVECDNVGRG